MFRRHIIVAVLACLGWVTLAQAAPIGQKDLENIAEKSGLPLWAFAVAMVPADGSDRGAFWYRPDAPMNPASAMKLVTTYSALELLGPHHTWATSIYANGNIRGAKLVGDLHIQLTGDPKLTEERLWRVLRDIKNSGIHHVMGDIVVDDSALRMPQTANVFDDTGDRPYAPYLVAPSPVLVNYNLHHLQMRVVDGQARATLSPELPSVELINQLTVEGSRCPSDSQLITVATTKPSSGTTKVILSGKVGKQCQLNRYLSVLSHQRYTEEIVAHLWQDMGGTVKGKVRFGSVPNKVDLLARSYSADVAAMVRDINKYSNNVMARQLFLNIGAQHRNAMDSDDAAAARRVIAQWVEEKGINASGLILDNGSGLSRSERLTVRQTAELLEQAWKSSFAAEFIASLPLVALDGTLRRRMNGSGLEGEGHLKTGALANARALAGYIRDSEGRPWILVFYVNHANAAKVLPVLDEALVTWHHASPTSLASN